MGIIYLVAAYRDYSDQRWGVAVKKFKGGRYLSLSRENPGSCPFLNSTQIELKIYTQKWAPFVVYG